MFKYIAEILAQFSRTQKVLALLMVLLSVIIISLAPSFINAMTVDCEELKSQIERQDKRIISLEDLVDTLDAKIRNDQRECTNEITSREVEFVQMLEELKKEAKIKDAVDNTPVKNYAMERMIIDTVSEERVSAMVRMPEPVVTPKPKTSMKSMINKIEQMQLKIKNNN